MAANKGVTVEMIRELAAQGLTCSEIADSLGVSKTGISKRLKKYNIPHTTSAEKRHKVALQICELFKSSESMSLQDIASQFNVSKSRVSQILKKYKITIPTARKNSIRKNTVQEKYGEDNVMFVEDIVEKRNKYFIDKFGVDNPLKCEEIRKKAKRTLTNRYGVDNPLKSQEIKLKVRETNLERYGGPAPASCSKIKDKMNDSTKKIYGVDNFKRKHLEEEARNLLADKQRYRDKLIEWHHSQELTLTEIATKLGLVKSAVSRHMKEHNLEIKNFSRSAFERDIADFVGSLTSLDVYYNDRRFSFELDIYIPDLNFAIEANGLYYHSLASMEDVQNKKFYHRDKTARCREKQIKLFHITECDWYNPVKQGIWKSMITNAISPGTMYKVYARKCDVMEVKPAEARTFYNENHLQGFSPAYVHIGLVYRDELVSCMSFSKSGKNFQWELVRFASKMNTNVLGGASKLFKSFLKVYKVTEIHTFADLRYSYGNLYRTLGFECKKSIPPRYQYTDCKDLFHRRSFQKRRLSKMLGELYDPELTEFQNVFNFTKYRVIFDAGKLKFVYCSCCNETS